MQKIYFVVVGKIKESFYRDAVAEYIKRLSRFAKVEIKELSEGANPDAEKEERVISAKDEIPKSFILYKENGKYMICFSQISTASLMGRTETV